MAGMIFLMMDVMYECDIKMQNAAFVQMGFSNGVTDYHN